MKNKMNIYEIQCPICGTPVIQVLMDNSSARYQWHCPNCGIVNSAKWIETKEKD